MLAAVFLWAGAHKLARPRAAAAALRALGVPAPELTARALPVVELAMALALLTVPRLGAACALVTLAGFSRVLAARVRAGSTAPCGCLGTATHHPVSFVELLRNALLATLAVTALFASGPHVPTIEETITVSTLVVAGMVVVGLSRLRVQVGAVWSNREAREGALP